MQICTLGVCLFVMVARSRELGAQSESERVQAAREFFHQVETDFLTLVVAFIQSKIRTRLGHSVLNVGATPFRFVLRGGDTCPRLRWIMTRHVVDSDELFCRSYEKLLRCVGLCMQLFQCDYYSRGLVL